MKYLLFIILITSCVHHNFNRKSHVIINEGPEGYTKVMLDKETIPVGLVSAGELCTESFALNYPWRRKTHLQRWASLRGCRLLSPLKEVTYSDEKTMTCATCYVGVQ
jgi:hypothetical protein